MTNNREIKFRGFHRDENGKEKVYVNGGWVKGYWVYGVPASSYMITTVKAYVTIIPKTVGQYTGLKDKNGKEIFEGDIVQGIAYASQWRDNIVWIEEIASFGLQHGYATAAWENCSILKRATKGMNAESAAEIIGNIYENPELLEVK